MTILQVKHVSQRFGGHVALDDVSFSIDPGEIIGVIGRSGAGKSTLLRCLCGLERPDDGHVLLDGADLARLPERALVAARRKVGVIFQHFNLLESRTVAGNIALPLQIAGWPKAKIRHRVDELLEIVGLSGFSNRRPSRLSGGQKQRVGIARAIATSPALLLCDEATSALDPHTTGEILDLLADINRRLGLTIVLVTHEMDVVRRLARRVLILDAGKLIEDGSMAALLRSSRHDPRLERLLADIRPWLPDIIARELHAEPAPGRLPVLRVVLDPESTTTAFISTLARRFDGDVTIIQCGISDCGDKPSTDLIIRLSGPLTPDSREFLDDIAYVTEVLGYVPAHR